MKKTVIIKTNAFMITDGTLQLESTFLLNSIESIVVNTKNDFELALVLKKKELNAEILSRSIFDRIEEKKESLIENVNQHGICLIGHSQIDNWEIHSINGMPVRNCGIRGISSFEYDEYILKSNLLGCYEEDYIVMHGTNDIVCDYSFEEIYQSITNTINYIRERKPNSRIYFIQCIHVNGRLDRSNQYIDALNDFLREHLRKIYWIDTGVLNDEFGNLRAEYTKDGLHLSNQGYAVLQKIIEDEVMKVLS